MPSTCVLHSTKKNRMIATGESFFSLAFQDDDSVRQNRQTQDTWREFTSGEFPPPAIAKAAGEIAGALRKDIYRKATALLEGRVTAGAFG